MSRSLAIERVPIASLHEDERNARRHGERNIAAIKASIERFGQQKPIVVDATGMVVAGNGQLAAMRSLGLSEVDIVRTTLEGHEARAYAIADNKTGDLAAWNHSELVAQLNGLEPSLVAATGFSEAELQRLIADESGVEPPTDWATKFQILVDCRDERDQAAMITRLEAEGYPCRPLVSM